ncbi:MAG TPA: hypothetical protein VHG09_05445 [Longimicrobiales bacterium]|nr:hypothetical protein [Longimicrobiales bacterium]
MNRTARLARHAAAVCAILLASACASSGTTADGTETVDPDAVAVTVNNDLIPPSSVTVWIVPESGSRRRLGTLSPNGQETFSFSPTGVGEYRLLAEHLAGGSTVSNPFVLSDARTLTWRLSSSVVLVGSTP